MTKTCERCDGEGRVYDPTMADLATNKGTGMVECATCRGKGFVEKLTAEEMRAEFEALFARKK